MYRNYSPKKFQELLESTGETGFVEYINPPFLYISGLPYAKPKEVVLLEDGQVGEIVSLTQENAEVLVFSTLPTSVGTRVVRTGKVLEVPTSDDLLGATISPLGTPLYEDVIIKPQQVFRPIEEPSLDISHREKITKTFETGVAVVDLIVPLGKGQRELVIGDRKTGKTEFIQQCLLSQAKRGVICIYACIGKPKIDIKKVEKFIKKNEIADKCIVMASSNSDPLGLIFITPYAAMSLAEYFRDTGRDVLLVLDDLTNHAKYYREISLISKRFPGRSSYPGDIFYTHSRLLERAGNFKTTSGVQSITCLPVAETVEGDISGYIQTNLMSITDGHIFFDKDLFSQGRRPAVNYFLSVTRVGRQTQNALRWGVNRELNSFLILLEKTQSFVHFGAELNSGIRETLTMGSKILSFFDQPIGKVLDIELQIIVFSLIWVGAIKSESNEKTKFIVRKFIQEYETNKSFVDKVHTLINSSADFNVLLGKVNTKQSELLGHINYDR
jgi:F-type H+-transporting ATPase subunit alpha